MTKKLRSAIEAVIENPNPDTASYLEDVYTSYREQTTVTTARVEYLEQCLIQGMNKREAARALIEHDPRISRRTAETLVYTNFSGMYQNPRKRRASSVHEGPVVNQEAPPAISSEEDLL